MPQLANHHYSHRKKECKRILSTSILVKSHISTWIPVWAATERLHRETFSYFSLFLSFSHPNSNENLCMNFSCSSGSCSGRCLYSFHSDLSIRFKINSICGFAQIHSTHTRIHCHTVCSTARKESRTGKTHTHG